MIKMAMRLKNKTDYCLRVLIFLQTHKKKTQVQEIADCYNISKNHLSIAVNQLSNLGYIKTTQGPKGGIELDSQCLNRSIKRLVSEVEEFNMVECFDSKNNSCTLDPHCKLKNIFNRATMSFLNELNNHKIKDLI